MTVFSQGLFIVLVLFFNKSTFGYSNFFAYGYSSCVTCHYNTNGGGPLNDYGRALYATAIADKFLYPYQSDVYLSEVSGFLGGYALPKWLKPSIDYRGLFWKRRVGESNEENVYINMNLEYNLVFSFGKNNKYYYSYAISHYPKAEDAASGEDRDKFLSRENYFGWQISNSYKLQAGLFDATYGLRVPDHNAYSKSLTGLAENDQTVGMALFFVKPKFIGSNSLEGGLHLFGGNPSDIPDNRQVGASIRLDAGVSKKFRVGFSALKSESDFLKKYLAAFHGKFASSKGSGIIAELGYAHAVPQDDSSVLKNTYFFGQSLIRLVRGLHIITTFEVSNEFGTSDEASTYRFGPGLQWFPIQRLELRTELFNTRVLSKRSTTKDDWNIYSNLHVSF